MESDQMVTEVDVPAGDGRTLHAYSWGTGRRTVLWHHGTPNIGTPPQPLFAAARRLGIRFVSYDRPGYGGSTARPGRDVASAAGDATAVADALDVDTLAVLGHSGGGPHALACAALLPGRVTASVSVSGLAPFVAPFAPEHWFTGMGAGSAASLRAAVAGRAVKEAYTADPVITEPAFTASDWAALDGVWGWFGSVVEPAVRSGPGPLIDDDLAYVSPWGFDPAGITAPVLLVHGGDDLMVPASHSDWLAHRIPGAQVRVEPGAGHVSVLAAQAEAALEWIIEQPG